MNGNGDDGHFPLPCNKGCKAADCDHNVQVDDPDVKEWSKMGKSDGGSDVFDSSCRISVWTSQN